MVAATNNEGFVFLSTTPHSSFWSEVCFAHQNINGRDRNEEGEMKAIFTLHCWFAFPRTTADRRRKQVSSTVVLLHFPLLRAEFLLKSQKKTPPKNQNNQPKKHNKPPLLSLKVAFLINRPCSHTAALLYLVKHSVIDWTPRLLSQDI